MYYKDNVHLGFLFSTWLENQRRISVWLDSCIKEMDSQGNGYMQDQDVFEISSF
jgi:hypothetical protein